MPKSLIFATPVLALALAASGAYAMGGLGLPSGPSLYVEAGEKVIIKKDKKNDKIIVKKDGKDKKVVVVRPVKPWVKKPHYGQFIGGVALGSVLAATAAGVAPPPPAPNLCWYWSDPTMSRGYWDYC